MCYYRTGYICGVETCAVLPIHSLATIKGTQTILVHVSTDSYFSSETINAQQ